MSWQEKTSKPTARPDIAVLTPVEANAISGNFYKRILTPEEFNSPSRDHIIQNKLYADRPIDTLVKTILRIAKASKGGELGDYDVHQRRLGKAWNRIDSALKSDNESERKIAEALNDAILEVMPYAHVISSRST